MATNATGRPLGQREVRTTAYTCLRHGAAKNANGSQVKAGDLTAYYISRYGAEQTFSRPLNQDPIPTY
jgi:hypothetical protein